MNDLFLHTLKTNIVNRMIEKKLYLDIYNLISNDYLKIFESDKEWIIITKENCGFCLKAKNYFKEKDIDFNEINTNKNVEEIINKYLKYILKGHKTYPIIFYKNSFIGGTNELLKTV